VNGGEDVISGMRPLPVRSDTNVLGANESYVIDAASACSWQLAVGKSYKASYQGRSQVKVRRTGQDGFKLTTEALQGIHVGSWKELTMHLLGWSELGSRATSRVDQVADAHDVSVAAN
jgi:hypothetical protein